MKIKSQKLQHFFDFQIHFDYFFHIHMFLYIILKLYHRLQFCIPKSFLLILQTMHFYYDFL